MKRKRFPVEVPVELCRQTGIAEQIFYPSKQQYVGPEIDRIRQLTQLQEENVQLKKLVAELSPKLDDTAGCAGKNILKSSRRRSVMTYLAHMPGETASCLPCGPDEGSIRCGMGSQLGFLPS